MTEPGFKTTWLIAAVSFVICVGLVSHVFAAEPGNDDKVSDDPLVVRIDDYDIRESDVYQQIEALALGDQVEVRQAFEQFTESVVREEILFHALLASNFADEPELREQIKQTALNYLIDRHVTQQLSVSDEEVKDFYNENASAVRGENLRASQIVLADVKQCEKLADGIASDEEFAKLATTQSIDSESAQRGGDIGYMMPHGGPLGFEEELFAYTPGQMAIFESDMGCHVVRVTERETPPMPALADVQDRIRDVIARQKQASLLEAMLKRATDQVTVERP